jgi:cell division protein FtsL
LSSNPVILVVLILIWAVFQTIFMGTYKVRNEIETKRNEINENETKSKK